MAILPNIAHRSLDLDSRIKYAGIIAQVLGTIAASLIWSLAMWAAILGMMGVL